MTTVRDRSENYIISKRNATAAATIREKRQQFFRFTLRFSRPTGKTQRMEQSVLEKLLLI